MLTGSEALSKPRDGEQQNSPATLLHRHSVLRLARRDTGELTAVTSAKAQSRDPEFQSTFAWRATDEDLLASGY